MGNIPANLQLGQLQLPDILEGFGHPAVLLGADYRILATNHRYRQRFGDKKDLQDNTCFRVSHDYDRPCDQLGEQCPLHDCLISGEPRRLLHLHHTPYGRVHEEVTIFPIRDIEGKLVCYIEVLTEVQLAQMKSAGAGLVGTSRSFNHMLELIARVAPAQTPALLLGESGTGKELAAQAIHHASSRSGGSFVPVDCSGLTETLFESELFGHEKGAFTGAVARKPGLVEAASGGTLFLDELGDIPLNLQVKLLRLLETATFRRVGGTEPQQADFRLVCATHRDLKKLVAENRFRQDLYYRISAFPITMPPLRNRIEDLSLLARTLLKRIDPERSWHLARATLNALNRYEFPGNIRELRNILERATLLADGRRLLPEHLPAELQDTDTGSGPDLPVDESVLAPTSTGIVPLIQLEQNYLRDILATYDGNKDSLAKALGVSIRTLYRKLDRL